MGSLSSILSNRARSPATTQQGTTTLGTDTGINLSSQSPTDHRRETISQNTDSDSPPDTEMDSSDDYVEEILARAQAQDGLANLFNSDQVGQTSVERNQGIMAVFRMLIRSGQINMMSSAEESEPDEDEDDDEYLPENTIRKVRPPKEVYPPNQMNLKKNDIYLRMQDDPAPTRLTGTPRGLPNILLNRELGLSPSVRLGFDEKKKAQISSHFFPNNVRKICNFGYKAFCGTYSKDGSIFLMAAQDRAIRIFDTANGYFREMKKISARDVGWSVLDTAFSPDGQYIAYSSWSEFIHICKIDSDAESHRSLPLSPDTRRFCLFSIAFSDDGKEVLGGSNDGALYIYNRDLNQRVLKFGAHEEDVNAVTFADETSHILFSVADDAMVKVWDRRCLNEGDPKPVGILAGHIEGITFIDSKKDGRYLITNSKDQSIKLWDLRAFSSQETVTVCRDTINKNRWDYRWQRVPKRLCEPREPVPGDSSVMTYRGHSVLNTLIRCRFSPPNSTNQRFIYTGCAAGRVVIYDLLTGEIVRSLSGHDGVVRDVSWHPDSTEIVSTSWDGSLGYWTCESQHALSAYDEEILGIHTNPNVLRRSSRLARRQSAALTTMMDAQ